MWWVVCTVQLGRCHAVAGASHSWRNSVLCMLLLSQYRDGIARWIKKKTGPAAATIEDKDSLAAAEKESEVVVIGYFKDFKAGFNILSLKPEGFESLPGLGGLLPAARPHSRVELTWTPVPANKCWHCF
eukprot:GHRR01029905.1.p1 GENE.GHRR01029905.1~~GHRR01029905.1.p1  ORF type:complete len:129 (-),score=34.02 GHRR01029905.1:667-1053(-)